MRINTALVLVLAGVAPLLAQQTPPSRTVHVVVTDPLNRMVTGLPQQDFDVIENGNLRPTTAFSDGDSPMSIAIVAQSVPVEITEITAFKGVIRGNEILQFPSVADALGALAASKNSRKALILTSGTIIGEIPSEIQVMKTDPQNLRESVIEVMNSYSLWFSPSCPTSAVVVNLRKPRGLPPLTVTAR
jgi:hypothetical protein